MSTIAQETLPQKLPWWRETVIRGLLRVLEAVAGDLVGAPERSPPPPSGPQPSHTLPEDKRVLLESFDNFALLRGGLARTANIVGEWAGIPMPLEGTSLVISPRYPFAEVLTKVKSPPSEKQVVVRNSWWSTRLHGNIFLYEREDGEVCALVDRQAPHAFGMSLNTLGASVAWGIEQEAAAVRLLAELISHHALKMYLLTGMFLETSKRSGVTYVFRKLRPTVALDARKGGATDHCRILCTLCLHPIAYYEGSWAGAMTPTDDVIAHLQLMRGDEHMFWKRANQHPPDRPEAGL